MLIRFAESVPKRWHREIHRHVKMFGPYFLRTVDAISIRTLGAVDDGDGADGKTLARIHVLARYREVAIELGERWYTAPKDVRAQTFAHELAHVVTDPVSRVLEHLAKNLEGEAGRLADCMIEEAVETVTQDLTLIVCALLGEHGEG